MSQQIPLSQGKFATVDDEDFEWLSRCKWSYDPKGYAIRAVRAEDKTYMLYMHRAILNASGPCVVDHIDGDGLNNQRANLRIATVAQNVHNTRPQKRSKTSAYKGVSRYRKTGKWQASIKKSNERLHLGLFDTEEDAARAYNAAARHLFGSNAYVNAVSNDTLTFDDLPRRTKSSVYRGVTFAADARKWKAQIQVKGVKKFIGRFTSEEAAARAYDAFVLANGLGFPLNFPHETT
jgi:hypothetical protein